MAADLLKQKETGGRRKAVLGKNTQSNIIENRCLLLHIIFEDKEISRKELAEKSGLTAATVTILTSNFIEKGIIEECGLKDIGGARKVRMLRMNTKYAVISVRLHRTYFSVSVFDVSRKRLYKNRIHNASYEEPENIVKQLEAEVINIKKIAKKNGWELLGLMLGVNEPVLVKGENYFCFNINDGAYYDLKKILQKNIGLPVEINRNGNLCSYQLWKGVWGRKEGTVVAMLISYSLECGIVIDGKVLANYHGKTGMIGAMRYKMDAGQWLTFDDVSSVPALLKRANELKSQYIDSGLNEKDEISIQDLVESYMCDDQLSKQVYGEMADHYAEALVRVVNILNPDLLFVGGSIPLTKEYQLEIFEKVARILFGNDENLYVEDDTKTGIITFGIRGKEEVLRFVSPEIEGTLKDPVYGGLEYFMDVSIDNDCFQQYM